MCKGWATPYVLARVILFDRSCFFDAAAVPDDHQSHFQGSLVKRKWFHPWELTLCAYEKKMNAKKWVERLFFSFSSPVDCWISTPNAPRAWSYCIRDTFPCTCASSVMVVLFPFFTHPLSHSRVRTGTNACGDRRSLWRNDCFVMAASRLENYANCAPVYEVELTRSCL